ncbi:hypothetical protein L7F22_028243 [Adiantum nelumboides]|nr:hypothetical protein [Adiantum nelumboides]
MHIWGGASLLDHLPISLTFAFGVSTARRRGSRIPDSSFSGGSLRAIAAGLDSSSPSHLEFLRLGGEDLAFETALFEEVLSEQLRQVWTVANLPDCLSIEILTSSSHFAGSFGHFQASKSSVHKGGLETTMGKAGFVATRISWDRVAEWNAELQVTKLNQQIVGALASDIETLYWRELEGDTPRTDYRVLFTRYGTAEGAATTAKLGPHSFDHYRHSY